MVASTHWAHTVMIPEGLGHPHKVSQKRSCDAFLHGIEIKKGDHHSLSPTCHLKNNIHSGKHYKIEEQIDTSLDLTVPSQEQCVLSYFLQILRKTWVIKL